MTSSTHMNDSIHHDSLKEWQQRALAELKGKPLESLNWTSEEGLPFSAYYNQANGATPFPVLIQNRQKTWMSPIHLSGEWGAEMNKKALNQLSKGATSLFFSISSLPSQQELLQVLKGIEFKYIYSLWEVEAHMLQRFADLLAKTLAEMGQEPEETEIGLIPHLGTFDALTPKFFEQIAELISSKQALYPKWQFTFIPAWLIDQLGGNQLQELHFALSYWSELVHALRKTPALTSKLNVGIATSSGVEYFSSLCKNRIISRLLNQISSEANLESQFQITCRLSIQSFSSIDIHNNLLRACTSGMAALQGNVNHLLIPSYHPGNEEAERISLNIGLLLEHEAKLMLPADPIAGAWFPELLSTEMAQKAWELFLNTESQGGLINTLEFWNNELLKVRSTKLHSVASRKTFLLGVNQYPGKQASMCFDSSFRMASIFEALREKTAQLASTLGHQPSALLYQHGDTVWRNLRANFAQNFLGCAGFQCIIATELPAEKFDLVVLCSSDAEYPALIKSKNYPTSKLVLLAGNPGEHEQEWRSDGISDFLHTKSNLLQTLHSILDQLSES